MKIVEAAAVSNTTESEEMEIGIFSTYRQAIAEAREILRTSNDINSDFIALPKITQYHDGKYRVTLTVKKKKNEKV